MHCCFAKLGVHVFRGEAFEQKLGRERGQGGLRLDRPRETSEVDRQERVAIYVDAAAGYRARKDNIDLGNGTVGNVVVQGVSQPVRETRNRLDMRGHRSRPGGLYSSLVRDGLAASSDDQAGCT